MNLNYSSLEKLLIENCQAGTFITNVSGKLIHCNPAFVKMYGYTSKEDMLLENATSLYTNLEQRQSYLDTLLKNKSVRNYYLKGVKKDGSLIDVSVNSDLYEDGECYIVGSVIDISDSLNYKTILDESEKKYHDLFENSLELIQSFDKNGKLLFCNNTWHNKLEYDKEEIKNLTLFDIIADKYKEHCSIMFQMVIAGESIKGVEVEFVSKSGKVLVLEGNIVPLFKKGSLIATHGFFRDVTEKSKVIKQVIEQEQLLQTVFNTVPICLYIKDSNGKYLHANKTMEQTLGCAVNGQNDTDIFPKISCHKLNVTDTEAISKPDELIRYEFDVELNNIKKHFLCGKKAIFNKDAHQYKIFGFSVDISEIKNSSRIIEESEQLLQTIVNNSNGGFLLFDFDEKTQEFELEYCNTFASELVQLKSEKANINEVFGFIPDEFMIEVKSDLADTTKVKQYDWKKTDTNGDSRFYSIRFTSIRNAQSNPKVIVYIFDVTLQNRLIEELEKRLNENKVLVGEVHHRVKNNLAVIDGILELKKFKIENEELKRNISDIQIRIKSIALVHQKLYQTGNFTGIYLYDYTDELSKHYKKIYDSDNTKQIQFKIDTDKSCKLNISQSITFGLLLSELISNSIKYGIVNNKLTISIGIVSANGAIKINYQDSGNGLPEKIKDFRTGGFGFRLMENLMKQLKATHVLHNGAPFKIEFDFTANE